MNEDDLIEKIYEYLGLDVGSLSSEGGNDWERAKKEVLADYRREQSKNISEDKEINYLTVDKSLEEFQYTLNSNEVILESKREYISKRIDLNENELSILIKNSSKEILINIVRNYKLSQSLISSILDKSVFLVNKILVEKHQLNDENKSKLLYKMSISPNLYGDLINKLGE